MSKLEDFETARARIAVIGDLHDQWTDADVASLNAAGYDLILFVGDLGQGEAASRRIALSIARLECPGIVVPGNADAPHAAALAAEFSVQRGLGQLFHDAPALDGVRLGGYSLHRFALADGDLTVLCGRPYSMGGPELSFGSELHNSFGVGSMEDSAKRLADLVDQVETERLLILAHNGPHGLGSEPTDPWSCDFLPDAADWGDADLSFAIRHSRERGLKLVAVVAGHMHLALRGRQDERSWQRRVEDVLYLSPARVPRIVRREGRELHHHVALTLSAARGDGAWAEEILL